MNNTTKEFTNTTKEFTVRVYKSFDKYLNILTQQSVLDQIDQNKNKEPETKKYNFKSKTEIITDIIKESTSTINTIGSYIDWMKEFDQLKLIYRKYYYQIPEDPISFPFEKKEKKHYTLYEEDIYKLYNFKTSLYIYDLTYGDILTILMALYLKNKYNTTHEFFNSVLLSWNMKINFLPTYFFNINRFFFNDILSGIFNIGHINPFLEYFDYLIGFLNIQIKLSNEKYYVFSDSKLGMENIKNELRDVVQYLYNMKDILAQQSRIEELNMPLLDLLYEKMMKEEK